jgi:hypothetical protein
MHIEFRGLSTLDAEFPHLLSEREDDHYNNICTPRLAIVLYLCFSPLASFPKPRLRLSVRRRNLSTAPLRVGVSAYGHALASGLTTTSVPLTKCDMK